MRIGILAAAWAAIALVIGVGARKLRGLSI
jgi:hypothetical protein